MTGASLSGPGGANRDASIILRHLGSGSKEAREFAGAPVTPNVTVTTGIPPKSGPRASYESGPRAANESGLLRLAHDTPGEDGTDARLRPFNPIAHSSDSTTILAGNSSPSLMKIIEIELTQWRVFLSVIPSP